MAKLTKAQTIMFRQNTTAARMKGHIEFHKDGCWLWTGSKTTKGYGFMAFRGRTWRAHRVAYTVFVGEVPQGLMVCHHCDTPSCVNPAHLFLGHAKTNMLDMIRKGRGAGQISSSQDHFANGGPPSGEKAKAAKLTRANVVEILERGARGELTKALADEFGVERSSIQRLFRGESFKDVPRPAGLPRLSGVYSRNAGRAALTKEKQDG